MAKYVQILKGLVYEHTFRYRVTPEQPEGGPIQ